MGRGGKVLVGSAATGGIDAISTKGKVSQVVAPSGSEVAGLSQHRGTLTWGTSVHDEGTFAPVSAALVRRDAKGRTRTVDLLAYEKATNPDARSTYGFVGLAPDCAAQLPPELLGSPGGIDSHPYGTVTNRGRTYVADAGANAVLSVDPKGKVRTVAVLPPVKAKVTAAVADGLGLPGCVVGKKVALEPVPTDVEVGRDGFLYVTTLPGGPEDGSLGALGAVHRVNPRTGTVKTLASGFSGATGLAVAPRGTIYVTELFSGEVSKVDRRGKVSTLFRAESPAAIEYSRGKLVVSTKGFTEGTVVVAKAR